MTYIPSLIKIGPAIQKLIRGGYTGTWTACRLHKPAFVLNKVKMTHGKKYRVHYLKYG
jgi:hypothetical protein